MDTTKVSVALLLSSVLFAIGLVMGVGATCYLATVHESLLVSICCGIMVGVSIIGFWLFISENNL